MERMHLKELLLQSLEHERGGVQIYKTALDCVVNEDLEEEWEAHLQETERHVQILSEVFAVFGVDTEEMSPGRQIVADLGAALVAAMRAALESGPPDAAELVACECVVLAETKDHLDWELIGEAAKKLSGGEAKARKHKGAAHMLARTWICASVRGTS
jgi:rubrerythrin